MANVQLEYLLTARDQTKAAFESVMQREKNWRDSALATARLMRERSEHIRGSAATMAQGMAQVGRTAGSTQMVVGNLLYTIQDLPYGFRGVSNNLDFLAKGFIDMRTQMGSTKAAFGALRGALMGPIGIAFAISGVIALIQILGNTFRSNAEEAKKAADGGLKDYWRRLDDIARSMEALSTSRLSARKDVTKQDLDAIQAQIKVWRQLEYQIRENNRVVGTNGVLAIKLFDDELKALGVTASSLNLERLLEGIDKFDKEGNAIPLLDRIKKKIEELGLRAEDTATLLNALGSVIAADDPEMKKKEETIRRVGTAWREEADRIKELFPLYGRKIGFDNKLVTGLIWAIENQERWNELQKEEKRLREESITPLPEVAVTQPKLALPEMDTTLDMVAENFENMGLTAQNTANLITGAFESTADLLAGVMTGAIDDIDKAFKRLVQSIMMELTKLAIMELFKTFLSGGSNIPLGTFSGNATAFRVGSTQSIRGVTSEGPTPSIVINVDGRRTTEEDTEERRKIKRLLQKALLTEK